VYVQPEQASASKVMLATNAALATVVTTRPRIDATDETGSALSSDPPVRVPVVGETVYFTVTNSTATGVTWQAVIKYEGQ
jgi:hypothetical protein